jgi:hypothetical protein
MPKGAAGLLSGGFDETLVSNFAKRLTTARLLHMADILRDALLEISKGTGGKLAAELCLIRLADKRADNSLPALALRLSELEKTLENGAVVSVPAPVIQTDSTSDLPVVKPQTETKTPARSVTSPPDGDFKNVPPAAAEPVKQAAEAGPVDETPKAPALSGGNLGTALLERIKPVVGVPCYQQLAGQVTATAEKNALVLGAKTPYIMNLLNKPDISAAIRDALPDVLGRNLPVRVVLDTASDGGSADKLDSLLKFGNVTIEG